MEQMPKVSIIVPVYNVAPYLRQCMDSIINQTYQNIEIICVDDGSTDAGGSILEQYANVDGRVKVFSTRNSGVAAARNTALSHAGGEYVVFVDGDDWIDASACEKSILEVQTQSADLVMWAYIREFPDHSAPKIVFPERTVFNEGGCRSLQRRMIGLSGRQLAHPENADALSTVWGKLYRRDIIERFGISFTDLERIGTYEDGLFNLNYLAHASCAVYIPDCLSHYRKNTGMTSKYRNRLPQQWKNLFADMRRCIADGGYTSDFSEALNNRISLSIIGLGLNSVTLPTREALSEIKRILSDKEYRAAIKTLPMRYFPPHWWVFFACCKLNFSAGVFLLLKCMERMIG